MQRLDLAAPIGYNGRYGNGIWGGISVTKQTVLNQLYRGIIVSCQALPGEPLHGRGMMAAMAQAARAPRVICLINKSDRPLAFAPEELRSRFPHLCVVSAATGAGLDALGETVAALFPAGGAESAGELLTNARQADAARRALEAVTRASESLEAGITPDALLTDAEEALAALGELTGASVREDVTARIFERFCVGK